MARSTSGFVWIGLQQPTAEDIAANADEFALPPLAVEDRVKAHQRPKLEVSDDVVSVVLSPVRYVDHEEVVDVSEIADVPDVAGRTATSSGAAEPRSTAAVAAGVEARLDYLPLPASGALLDGSDHSLLPAGDGLSATTGVLVAATHALVLLAVGAVGLRRDA